MITRTHKAKDEFNKEKLNLLEGEPVSFVAKDEGQVPSDLSNYNIKQTQNMPNILQVKVNCPVVITTNINKADKLTNGTFGRVVEIDEANEIIWVKFQGDIGAQTRNASRKKLRCHVDKDAVPIRKSCDRVTIGGKTFRRRQFSLDLAYAITTYMAQGMTRDIIMIDFSGMDQVRHGEFFVAFSRCTSLDGVFLKNFKKEYVYCDPAIRDELERLRGNMTYKFQKTYFDACDNKSDDFKVVFLNICGLTDSNHLECLRKDKNLLAANLICIAETKLSPETDSQFFHLEGFSIHTKLDYRDRSMGMIIYTKNNSNQNILTNCINNDKFQIIFCTSPSIGCIVFVYLRPPLTDQSWDAFINSLDVDSNEKVLGIIGDLNIRSERNQEKLPFKIQWLCEKFDLVNTFSEVTHNAGNQLDYCLIHKSIQEKCASGSFMNMYSDHKSLFLRIFPKPITTIPSETSCNPPKYEEPKTNLEIRSNPCFICKRVNTSKSLLCAYCNCYIHKSCTGFSKKIKAENFKCVICRNKELKNTNGNVSSDSKTLPPFKKDFTKPVSSVFMHNQGSARKFLIPRFENKSGDNVCWLNVTLQILLISDQTKIELQSTSSSTLPPNQLLLINYIKHLQKHFSEGKIYNVKAVQNCESCQFDMGNRSFCELYNSVVNDGKSVANLPNHNFNDGNQQDPFNALEAILYLPGIFEHFHFELIFEIKCLQCEAYSDTSSEPIKIFSFQSKFEKDRSFKLNEALISKQQSFERNIRRKCGNTSCTNESLVRRFKFYRGVDTLLINIAAAHVLNSTDKIPISYQIPEYITIPEETGPLRLKHVATGIHSGKTTKSGHYTCHILSRQIWWKADDSTINKLNCRPSNVGSHENTDTPVFILYSKTSNLPPSEISPPQQTSSNTASSHSIRSSNHNLIKLENNGTNVCWLNCVFQILFHTEKIHNQNSFTEDHYDYDDAIYNFIQYHINHQTTQMNLNNPVINNPENNTYHISFKQMFSLLVQRNEYATTAQQDPMEGLDLLLGVSRHFRYFAFREMHTYACPMCGLQIHDVNGPEVTNILRLPVHNDHAIHLGESIKQYFSPKPMTESNCPNNQCPSQNRTSTYVITKAPTFLIIQLLIFDRRLRKKKYHLHRFYVRRNPCV